MHDESSATWQCKVTFALVGPCSPSTVTIKNWFVSFCSIIRVNLFFNFQKIMIRVWFLNSKKKAQKSINFSSYLIFKHSKSRYFFILTKNLNSLFGVVVLGGQTCTNKSAQKHSFKFTSGLFLIRLALQQSKFALASFISYYRPFTMTDSDPTPFTIIPLRQRIGHFACLAVA